MFIANFDFLFCYLLLQNSSKQDCYQAVFYITKISNKDIGEYSFIVKSPKGLSEGLFNINMTYASGYNIKSASVAQSHFARIYINVIIFIIIIIICYI